MLRAAILAVTLLLLPSLAAAQSQTKSSRYGAWQGGEQSLKTLSEELRALVDEAEKARAANPLFLKDLRDLIRRYDNPWSVRVIDEDFKDGDFATNPTWTVASGKFGMGWEGLLSTVKPQQAAQPQKRKKVSREEMAIALLGVLGGAKRTSSQPAAPQAPTYEPAEIFLQQRIPNAFAMTLDISGRSSEGGLDFAVYQGAGRNVGYRLTSTPGRGLQLLRLSSRGTVTLGDTGPSVKISDGAKHQIVWKRAPEGTMSLSLDGKEIISASDTAFRQAFDGLTMVNRGGEFSLNRLTIDGAR